MRIIILFVVLLQSLVGFSQGQVEMNSKDSTFITAFEASEKLWETFVEGQFQLKFPEYESWETRREIYGSQFDMLYFNFMKMYCDLRISTLYDLFEE